ncbi:hypothetical protein SH501x_001264 [Pirellulaceae bacterium SH501]
MDKKARKLVAILRQRVQKLQKMLAGAKSQSDVPDEVRQLEQELQDARAEIERLTSS